MRAPALALALALFAAGCASAPSADERASLEVRGIPPPQGSTKVADSVVNGTATIAYRYANDTSVPTLTATWAREVGKVSWEAISSTVHENVGDIRGTKSDLDLHVWLAHSNATTCCEPSEDAGSAVMVFVVVATR